MTPLDKMAAALALSQSGEDCFEALEPEAQEALRENVRAVLVSAWQPIETAPKEPGRILVFGNSHINGIGFPMVCWWNSVDEKWTFWADESQVIFAHSPTHWMPLPDAPDTALTDQS